MLPLKDKTILVTRSENQVKDFIQELQQLGAETITLPLIKNAPINQNQLKEVVSTNEFDWIIFTSANAVRFFFQLTKKEQINSRIAVVGAKTAQLVNEEGLSIDFMPTEFSAKHLAEEIPVKSNDKILIPRSEIATNHLIEILENKSCKVFPIAIYNNHPITYTNEELSKILCQPINYITFTSGSTVNSFIQLGIQLDKEKVICIGPETAKIAEQFDIKVTAIANPHTIEGMINAIVNLSKIPH